MLRLFLLFCIPFVFFGCITTKTLSESYTKKMAERRSTLNSDSRGTTTQIEFTCGFKLEVSSILVEADSLEMVYPRYLVDTVGSGFVEKTISNTLVNRIVLIDPEEGRRRAAKAGFMIVGGIGGGFFISLGAIYSGFEFLPAIGAVIVSGLVGMLLGGTIGTEKGMIAIYTFSDSPPLDRGSPSCIALKEHLEIN